MEYSRMDYLITCVLSQILTAPITTEDPFVTMWCNAKFLQICFEWTNKHPQYILNYSFKLKTENLAEIK